jgi:hypothetical protein
LGLRHSQPYLVHELATQKPAFQGDWNVQEYYMTTPALNITLPQHPPFLKHHVGENIHDLLNRDRKLRPNASSVCQLFSAYCRILDSSVAQVLSDSNSLPLYLDWKQLVSDYSYESDLQFQLAEMYAEKEQ